MGLNAVPNTVKQESQTDMGTATVAMALRSHEKCFPRFVPIMAREPKYRSNPVMAGRCIVAIAFVK
jgi:hypothetical protein